MAWFSKSRMEALADGIFAISMTLLVASLIFPGLIEGIGPAMSFNELLLSFIKDLIYYGIAFFILAIYWIYHHLHYYVVTRLDMVSIWLMLASLFFVALMPVSTAITAYYSQNPRADIFFELNLLAIGLFYMLHWWYATRGGRLTKKPIAPLVSCIALRKGLIVPVVSVIAVILAIAALPWSILCYISVPFLERFMTRSCQHSDSEPPLT